MNYENNLSFAQEEDAKDPLNKWRNEFHIPVINGKKAYYFTGNSLGCQPKRTRGFVEAEMQKLVYQFATEMSFVVQKHLPNILEGIASEMRQNADKVYKCKLLEGGSYECK